MFRKIPPTAILLLGFLCVILLGGTLLSLPFSSASGSFTSPLVALFTATSATCVTGLSVVDTASYWSAFGKCVILLLIQVGGLGFMSLAVLFARLLRKRVSPKQRLIFIQSMNLSDADGMPRFLRRMFGMVLTAEAGGALLLFVRFLPRYGFGKALGYGVFHAVSAFCNAGFDLFGNSLAGFAEDGFTLGVISVLILAGGLGFIVWDELVHWLRERRPLSLYARLVLGFGLFLLLFGMGVYLASEWNNPLTIGRMSLPGKLWNGFFQSVTMRTAGFASFSQGGMRPLSLLISLFLMFIGGASGSTAGGIKTATFAILPVAALQIFRGRGEVRIRRRQIPAETVLRAFALVFFGGVTVFLSILLLSFTEPFSLGELAFEVVSAFGTVGVTTGITAEFTVFGKLWLMLLMFLGRLGVSSVAYALLLGMGRKDSVIRYPKADLPVG